MWLPDGLLLRSTEPMIWIVQKGDDALECAFYGGWVSIRNFEKGLCSHYQRNLSLSWMLDKAVLNFGKRFYMHIHNIC